MMFLLLGGASSAFAQGIDADPPSIEPEFVSEGIRGDSQVFTATVDDNVLVTSVLLNYRFGAEGPYRRAPMNMLASTGIYTLTVETANVPDSIDAIYYYIEALDAAGNRTLHGFAFDPVKRFLVDVPQAITKPSNTIATGMSTQRKIIFGALGVLIVGALASGSSPGSAESSVPITVIGGELP